MATTSEGLSSSVPEMRPVAAGVLRRLSIPSFSDCFFLAVLIWLFLAGPSGWKGLLMDGDTGWHIRTGEYILDHGIIPHNDLFSFTKAGASWFAWEWLSDIIFGALFRLAGLKGVVLFSGLLIGLYATVLLRFSLWRGANVMMALPWTLLAVGSSTIHFLARPHLFTLLLLPLAIWMLEADLRRPGRAVWLLIPITAVWTNLHGGFAVFLVCLGLMVAGLTVESYLISPRWPRVRRYAVLWGGCLFATCFNPFGFGLHAHILEYLKADWIRNLVQEFQAPTFRSEGQLHFEILLAAGLMTAATLIRRGCVVETLWILFLAHSSLTSVRHAPLFAAVTGPILAAELTGLWNRQAALSGRGSLSSILNQLGRDLGPAFRRTSVWLGGAVAVIALLRLPAPWPADFPKEAFPVDTVQRHLNLLAGGRVFTTDQWADYLIYRSYPLQRVFIDGRSDFYGEALGREYLTLMQGAYPFDRIFDRYGFDLALIPVEWPLAQYLKTKSEWRVLEDDGHSILFSRRPRQAASAGDLRPNGNVASSRTYSKRADHE